MQEFRTTFSIPKATPSIDYGSAIMVIGSCFSENMSKRFSDNKFHVYTNPGVIYNPFSIAEILYRIKHLEYFNRE
jgi:hypothetical protein